MFFATTGGALDLARLVGLFRRGSDEPAVYHRYADEDEAALVETSGEVWGLPPRNTFASDIPCVKAYAGRIPAGGRGYEFTTDAAPRIASPSERRWIPGMPGVREEDGYAKIRVTLIRNTTRSE
jgi:hypothetical protein